MQVSPSKSACTLTATSLVGSKLSGPSGLTAVTTLLACRMSRTIRLMAWRASSFRPCCWVVVFTAPLAVRTPVSVTATRIMTMLMATSSSTRVKPSSVLPSRTGGPAVIAGRPRRR